MTNNVHVAVFSSAEKEHKKDRQDNFKLPLICQTKLETSYYHVDFFLKLNMEEKRRLQTSQDLNPFTVRKF